MKQHKVDCKSNKSSKIIIDNEIIKKASDCPYNFACLNNNGHVCCKVISCVNNEVHFIEEPENKFCPYKVHFADSSFCSCPVRKEIYNKHGE